MKLLTMRDISNNIHKHQVCHYLLFSWWIPCSRHLFIYYVINR